MNHYIIVEKEKKKLEQEFNNQVRAMEDLKNNVRFLEDKTKKMNEL